MLFSSACVVDSAISVKPKEYYTMSAGQAAVYFAVNTFAELLLENTSRLTKVPGLPRCKSCVNQV